MFFYCTKEEVEVGDHVLWAMKEAIVEHILEPGSKEAEGWGIPEGGVMFLIDWEGDEQNRVLQFPDEDIEFVKRGNCTE